MEASLQIISFLAPPPPPLINKSSSFNSSSRFLLLLLNKGRREYIKRAHSSSSPNGSIVCSSDTNKADSRAVVDAHRQRSGLESLFCYDKPIPEEIIEKPVGLSLEKREIGGNPPCTDCQAKGVVLCATCSGSGLYVDSIMESQGIIVKIRCLGETLKTCFTWDQFGWVDFQVVEALATSCVQIVEDVVTVELLPKGQLYGFALAVSFRQSVVGVRY